MQTTLRLGALVFFLSLFSSIGFAQVIKGPPKDPGFAYEDFNHNGLYDEGVDLKLDLPPNYTPRTPANTSVSIWPSDAGWDAMADLVFPPSVRRLDGGPYSGSNVFIYTQGALRIGRGVVVRADTINLTGNGGVFLEYCTVNGGTYVGVEGPLQATAVSIHANYVITYGRTLTSIDRSRIIGDSYVTVTADEGRLELTRTTIRAGWTLGTRGEMHGDALVLVAPEVTVEEGGETGPVPHSLTRSSVVLGQGGTFNMMTDWFAEAAKPIDLSKSVVTGSYVKVNLCGSPCLLPPKAVRGPSPVVTITP